MKQKPTLLLTLIFLATGLVKLVIMIWSVNRGFDIGDEGLYMLSLKDPEQYSVLAHGHYLNFLLPIKEFTIPISRSISIVLELLGGSIFSYGAYQWLQKKTTFHVPFFLLWSIVLAMSFQSILARCVSYNDIGYFAALSAGGMFLYGFSTIGGKQLLAWALSGFFAASCFVVKPPISISLGILFVLYLLVQYRSFGTKNIFKTIGSVALGYLIAFGGLSIMYQGLGWMDVVTKVKGTADLLNYSPLDLVLMYLIYDGTPNLVFLGIGIALFFGLRFLLDRAIGKGIKPFIISLSSTLIVGYILIHYWSILLVLEERPVYFYLWSILISTIASLSYIPKHILRQNLVTLLFIIALPLTVIGGTNGYITESLFAFWIPWAAVIGLGVWYLAERQSLPKAVIASVVVVLSLSAQFTYSKVLHPFGMPSDVTLLQQTQKVKGKDGLLVDTRTKIYFDTLQTIFHQNVLDNGVPIIALNYTPGLVYLVNGFSPGAPFYIYDSSFDTYNCHFMELSKQKYGQPVFLMRSTVPEGTMTCLTDLFQGFPDNYREPIIIDDPYYEVYEHDGYGDSKLYVYLPKVRY